MTARQSLLIIATVAATCLGGCNEKPTDSITDAIDQASALVKGFALKPDTNVLANLDSVFFTLDLDGGRIFNADSLPKGTDVSRLRVSLTTSSVRACGLTFTGADGAEKYVDYLASPNDSIDFSNGPVTLTLTSVDGVTTMNYEVRVNVHKMNPDSLTWSRMLCRQLPTTLGAPTAQRTVSHGDRALCLTVAADGSACMAISSNPLDDASWQMTPVALPASANPGSLTSAGGKLWILDGSGRLHSSADGGATWTATDGEMLAVFGAFNGDVVGSRRNADGSYNCVRYPSGITCALPAGFPVNGDASELISYTTDWSSAPMAIMVGGIDADGNPCAGSWAYDGSEWACLTTANIPAARGITLVPYLVYRTSDIWRLTRHSVLLAMGGADLTGRALRSVYISYDRGLSWQRASESLQLPSYIPAFVNADALVFSTEMEAGARAVSAITQWECPAIYLFGGMSGAPLIGSTQGNELRNTVWHGVLNRLTFSPLY